VSDLLRDMVGLNQVKCGFIRLYDRSRLAMDFGKEATSSLAFNAILEGNPGTGRSTVAALYCTLLRELGAVHEASPYIEATAGSLLAEGPRGLRDRFGALQRANGGVVFVADAHDLLSDAAGRSVWDSILSLAAQPDTGRGRIVWVLAGPPGGAAALLAGGAAARGRFAVRLPLDDPTEDELVAMLVARLGRFKRAERAEPAEKGTWAAPYRGSEVKFDCFFNKWTRDAGAWTDEHGGCTSDPERVASSALETPDGRSWRLEIGHYWLDGAGRVSLFRPPNSSAPAGGPGWRRAEARVWASDCGELTQDWPSRRHLRPFAAAAGGGVARDGRFRAWRRDAASGRWADEDGGQALQCPLSGDDYELRTADGRTWRLHTAQLWLHRDGRCRRQRPPEPTGAGWRQEEARAWVNDAGGACLGWPSKEAPQAQGGAAPPAGGAQEEGQHLRCEEADARAAIRGIAARGGYWPGQAGPCNARAVEALVDGALLRQAARIMRGRRGGAAAADELVVTLEDLLGCE
jgi:hypothetical protein